MVELVAMGVKGQKVGEETGLEGGEDWGAGSGAREVPVAAHMLDDPKH